MSAGTDGVTGLDVSKWQATTPSVIGQEFLIARATIGTTADNRYPMHIANARKAGVMTGAYHFNWDTVSVASQVSAFLAAAGDVDLYALDVEGGNAFSRAQSVEFIKRVQDTGRKIGLYHSLSGFFDAGQDWNWVAYWATQPPPINWDIWQWGGYNGIDANRWRGTLKELQSLAGQETNVTPTPITDETRKEVTLVAHGNWYDLDGKTLLEDDSGELGWRISPYGALSMRAIFATVNGVRRTVLITPTQVRDIPVAVDDGFTKATQDAAVAAQKVADKVVQDAAVAAGVAAQKIADKAAIDAANSAAAKSAAAAIVASTTERERLAMALGKAEADKVRNT